MEEKKLVTEEKLENVTGGADYIVTNVNECPKCHSHAYTLILTEAGGVQHRECTSCHTEYWYKA